MPVRNDNQQGRKIQNFTEDGKGMQGELQGILAGMNLEVDGLKGASEEDWGEEKTTWTGKSEKGQPLRTNEVKQEWWDLVDSVNERL